MKDVAPELLEKLNKTFGQKVVIDPQIRSYKKKLEAGKLTERDCALYIRKMVSIAGSSVTDVMKPKNLPDEKLYWNIAEAVLVPFLKSVINQMNDIAVKTMKESDRKKNINIKVKTIRYPEGQIQSYLNMVVNNSMRAEGEEDEAGN
ncbi:MAG: hypothetical protein JTJ23_12820 [Fusicatenibacter saccharivorans]|uniref:Uncharacterized protein n=1 Tax=Fusicatenibacter saccharivorans TaxID=1150298 RepID=A0A939CH06_9FIRM|nr:hypothetical protein [Fusicatenibacter saccharivorans]